MFQEMGRQKLTMGILLSTLGLTQYPGTTCNYCHMLVFMLYLLELANGARRGDTRLLQSLTHIRPSHLLILKPAKVYCHATQINGNTTVTFCSSGCDL